MKAIMSIQPGPPEELILMDVAPLHPSDNEVIVSVKACAVNFPDALMIQDLYQFKAPRPFSPGGDIAGVIKKVGSAVNRFQPGDEVFGQIPYGGFAEEARAQEGDLLMKPKGIDYPSAASIMMVYSTVLHALKDRAEVRPGESLVVLGAAGGIGLASVEIGKILGNRVIAAASSDEKLDLCRTYGADETINYSKENLKQRIKELTDGKGADIILDPVGGNYSEHALRAVSWKGRFLVVGFTGGIPHFPLNLVLLKGCQVMGVFWKKFSEVSPEENRKNTIEIISLLQKGKLRPHVGKIYPLKDSPLALRDLMDRKAVGKLLVVN